MSRGRRAARFKGQVKVLWKGKGEELGERQGWRESCDLPGNPPSSSLPLLLAPLWSPPLTLLKDFLGWRRTWLEVSTEKAISTIVGSSKPEVWVLWDNSRSVRERVWVVGRQEHIVITTGSVFNLGLSTL